MNTYQRYTDCCSVCGKEMPKRTMNKILISYGHSSVISPKLVCHICDDCLPSLFEKLEVAEPEREVKWGKARSYCRKCYYDVGKNALYCSHCGNKLKKGK